MKRPDVSVVIVSYNTRELTLRCLRELVDSRTPQVRFDITVVDNASADGSADAIAERFPEVRLLRLSENVGWGRGVNRGAVASDGEYILLLNPDAAPVGTPVAELFTFARQRPEHRIYTGRTLHSDGTDDHYSCWGLPSLWSYVTFATGLSTVFSRHGWANPEGLPDYDRRSVREVPAVTGCFLLIERDLFNRLGGFDPVYFLYSDDIDLCARAARLGARPVLDPDAAVIHVGGASSSSEGQRMKILRGKATYVRLHWSPARARLGVGLLVAGVGLRALGRTLLGTDRSRGVNWATVWRERRTWAAGWPPCDEPRPPHDPAAATPDAAPRPSEVDQSLAHPVSPGTDRTAAVPGARPGPTVPSA
ncbi:glycosyltransferase family 2 protein [Micromonospora sp. WMMD812]|uniref:glycosyltransferase family 2 protein n=1 Tax=Micromonospora sp. WMMD812 TaxID=3015152 RepID=UPI00248BCB41|nr:glycosyltransferase family 2 protein [Micromonospora sp. WMMD812]WBB69608.1 glycosyltransferase family 2 protein [Micromonospora sp. WMMD812]